MNEHDINLLNNLLSKYQANQTNQILILTRLPVFFFPIITAIIGVSIYMPDILGVISAISAFLSLMLFVQYTILIIDGFRIQKQISEVEAGIHEKISLLDNNHYLSGVVFACFMFVILLSISTVFNLVIEDKKSRFEKDMNVTKQLNPEGNVKEENNEEKGE